MQDLFEKSGVALHSGPSFDAEQRLMHEGCGLVCGVDEVGRGPLAGPVVAAAVILDPQNIPDGLNDSKKLSATRREALNTHIHDTALSISIAQASVQEIDHLNILQASLLAMRRAVDGLPLSPDAALVDGNQDPGLHIRTETLVKGDSRSVSIAAASIIAKFFRDTLMADLAKIHPEYGWDKNAGYGVRAHMDALKIVGKTEYHRDSFKPIRELKLKKNQTNY